jgi:hypothetical protein
MFGVYKLIGHYGTRYESRDLFESIPLIIYLSLVTLISAISIFLLSPTTKFYWFMPRIWEFLFGALVYIFEDLIPSDSLIVKYSRFIQFSCLCVIYFLSAILTSANYPNQWTFLVCLVSSFFMLCRPSLSFRPLEWIGDLSYSIYLCHWPAIQMVKYVMALYVGQAPIWLWHLLLGMPCVSFFFCLFVCLFVCLFIPTLVSFLICSGFDMVLFLCTSLHRRTHPQPIVFNASVDPKLYTILRLRFSWNGLSFNCYVGQEITWAWDSSQQIRSEIQWTSWSYRPLTTSMDFSSICDFSNFFTYH